MECFSYKGGCGILECMHIDTLKEGLSWAIDKQLRLIININSYTTKNLKNEAVFNIVCVAM